MKNQTRMRDRATKQREALQGLAAIVLALTLVGAEEARAAEAASPVSTDGPSIILEEPASNADILRYLEMERGKSRFVRTAYAVKRVSVGDPEIVEVVVINTREFQLVAKNIGSTNVLVWDQSGRPKASIEVSVGTAYVHLERELQRILGNDAIQVESAGRSVVLKGSAPDALAAEHAMTLARAFMGQGDDSLTVHGTGNRFELMGRCLFMRKPPPVQILEQENPPVCLSVVGRVPHLPDLRPGGNGRFNES